MDSGTLIGVSIILGIAFLICSQAKDKNGKKYGIKRMSIIWAVAVGFLGAQAVYKITLKREGNETEISIVPFILLLIPVFMIGSNLISAHKKKKD